VIGLTVDVISGTGWVEVVVSEVVVAIAGAATDEVIVAP